MGMSAATWNETVTVTVALPLEYVRALIRGTFPWSRLRQARKLLRLAERYGAGRVNAACARALSFELLDVRRVETIVSAALEREAAPAERGTVVPLPGRFARPPQSFAHHSQKEDTVDGDRP